MLKDIKGTTGRQDQERRTQERRTQKRLKTQNKIKVHYPSMAGMKYQEGNIREISNTGLSFFVASAVDLPDDVRIEFDSSPLPENLKISSVITWRQESKLLFGVSFQHLSEGTVFKLQSIFPGLAEHRTTSIIDRRKHERRVQNQNVQRDLESQDRLIRRLKVQLRHRVAITGIGVVSPIGSDLDTVWERIVAGDSAVEQFDLAEVGGEEHQVFAARLKSFDPLRYISSRKAKRMNRHTQLAYSAASLAVDNAKLIFQKKSNPRCGVFIGTSVGGMEQLFIQHKIFLSQGIEKVQPFMWLNGSLGDAASEVAMMLKFNGPSQTICTGSASSTDAIGAGVRAIQVGDLDTVLAGGSEAPIFPEIMRLFEKSGVSPRTGLSAREAMKPFDKRREGFVLGEGAAFIVLENLENAIRRNAKIYAEIVGYGSSCDAQHHFASDPLGHGLAIAVTRALEDAGLTNSEVDYVNMHGTATAVGDPSETRAMKRVFGLNTKKMFFSSTKPMTGHLLGGSGALETAITTMAMQNNTIPPTLNLEDPDSECDLDFCPGRPRSHNIQTAANINIGFGGKNAVILLGKTGF